MDGRDILPVTECNDIRYDFQCEHVVLLFLYRVSLSIFDACIEVLSTSNDWYAIIFAVILVRISQQCHSIVRRAMCYYIYTG